MLKTYIAKKRGMNDVDHVGTSALLLSAFRLADIWNDLPRAIATVTSNPAGALGLHDRGALKTGLRGDVLRVRKIGETPLLRGVWSQGNKVG